MQVCRWLLACGASASVEAPPRASARHCCSPAGPASVPSTLGSSGGKPRCAGLKDTGPNAGRVGKRGSSSCRHLGWVDLRHPRVGSTSIAKHFSKDVSTASKDMEKQWRNPKQHIMGGNYVVLLSGHLAVVHQ